ncbi:MAG: hypothetical protein AAFR65_07875 [Pseudomonadota bacterium]
MAVAMTGCASVQLGKNKDEAAAAATAEEREAMAVALERLEDNPWDGQEAEGGDAFMTVLFGGSGPSPKDEAKAYLSGLEVSEGDKPSAVLRDVDVTLAAAWHMVDAGRAASESVQPQQSDVRMVEEAITEARHCRLVYAQAMNLMAKDGLDVAREDVIYVKDEFTRAILELGRTADALSKRVNARRPEAFASEPSMALTSSY